MYPAVDNREIDVRSSSRTSINVKIPSPLIGTHEVQTCRTLPSTNDSPELIYGIKQSRLDLENVASAGETEALIPRIQKTREVTHKMAVSVIERAWIGYRDKRMFRLLKHAVCAAENSLSNDILRKLCPREAELFTDKSQRVRVRFRFGGEEFPPMIFFKIYLHNTVQKVTYMSGQKMIRPSTEAAEDSLHQMGSRNFYNQILQDMIQQQRYVISDEVDITTLKDYMQYLANLDESPARYGGKENFWRKLTLDVLPRHTIFFDVVDFVYNNRITPRLKNEIHIFMARPVTQEILIQQIQAISTMRTPALESPHTRTSKLSGATNQTRVSSRRSKQARLKALKMRSLYSRENADSSSCQDKDSYIAKMDDNFSHGMSPKEVDLSEGSEEEWEKEAARLYEWTQELSFTDRQGGSQAV